MEILALSIINLILVLLPLVMGVIALVALWKIAKSYESLSTSVKEIGETLKKEKEQPPV